jgi:hypothetical protein
MTTKAKIYTGISIVLVIVLVLTVLNKKWWARRIMGKWDIDSNLAGNKELLFNTSLARMVQLYRKGMDGWQLRGTVARVASSNAEGVDLQEQPEFTN